MAQAVGQVVGDAGEVVGELGLDDVRRVGVEVVGVGVDAVEQSREPEPHRVEVGVRADVGLVLQPRREVALGTEAGPCEQHLADLHQQQGYDGAGVLLA